MREQIFKMATVAAILDSDQHDLAHFDPEVILLLQRKCQLKSTKGLGRDVEKLIFKVAAVVAILDFRSVQFYIFCVY